MRLIPQAWRELSALQRDMLVGFACVDEPTTAYAVYQQVNPEKDASNAYQILEHLKSKGYLEQVSEGDSKNAGNEVRITDAGRDLVKEAVVDPALQVK